MTEEIRRCPYCRTALHPVRRRVTMEAGLNDNARTEEMITRWECPRGHDWERGIDD